MKIRCFDYFFFYNLTCFGKFYNGVTYRLRNPKITK